MSLGDFVRIPRRICTGPFRRKTLCAMIMKKSFFPDVMVWDYWHLVSWILSPIVIDFAIRNKNIYWVPTAGRENKGRHAVWSQKLPKLLILFLPWYNELVYKNWITVKKKIRVTLPDSHGPLEIYLFQYPCGLSLQ